MGAKPPPLACLASSLFAGSSPVSLWQFVPFFSAVSFSFCVFVFSGRLGVVILEMDDGCVLSA